ncbi:MAG: SAM-dependent methyltransferase [Nanoarchaeota archaeon]
MAKFVIEHLEPEVYPWCLLEYSHISKRVGKSNLIFTNVINSTVKLKNLGEIKKESVKALKLKKACILDPSAKETLTPKIAKKFSFFIFGGILGDNPQRFRTRKELSSKLSFPKFNLGAKQMSTDTAVIVCKKIVGGKNLSELEFVEEYFINEGEGLERILPYRYLIERGNVVFAPGLKKLLKTRGQKL